MSQLQKSWEAVRRVDRLAPNLAHICRSIWELIYAKQIAPRDTRGALGGFRGQTFKSLGKLSNGWTIGTNVGYRLRIHLGMDTGYIQVAINTTGDMGGGVGGHKFKSIGKLSNGCTDWHHIWYTSADSSGNGHRLNTSRPTISQGHLGGGVRESQLQMFGEAVKQLDRLAPHLVQICGFLCKSS